MTPGGRSGGRPTVAVLARRWPGGAEAGWALRMVAGALATVADVTVYRPDGRAVRRWPDGVFRVVETGTASDASLEADRLVSGLLWLSREPTSSDAARALGATTAELESVVGAEFAEPWARAAPLLSEEVRPDLVVVCDLTQYAAARVARSCWGDVPLVVVPLVEAGAGPPPAAFAATLEEAQLAFVFTAQERDMVGSLAGVTTSVLGVPIVRNESVLRSPHELVGQRDYIALMTDAPVASPCPQASQARFAVSRFPEHTFALCGSDQLVVFEKGRSWSAEPAGRGTDALRLMAWASLTVDLHPGPLFARRSLESLVYGTPIVVPDASRAREHASAGRCGLWFAGLGELADAIEAASDVSFRERLAGQCSAYVESRCLSREGFVTTVLEAVPAALSTRDDGRPAGGGV